MGLFIKHRQYSRFNLASFIGLDLFKSNCILLEITDDTVKDDNKFGLQLGGLY